MGEGVTTSWADQAGTIFSNHLGKHSRDDNDDFIASLGNMDEVIFFFLLVILLKTGVFEF